jgi:hypothetical protein
MKTRTKRKRKPLTQLRIAAERRQRRELRAKIRAAMSRDQAEATLASD